MRKIIDNFGSAFWFSMDIAWMFGWMKTAGILIIPTLAYGILMFWRHKRNISDTLIDIATLSWMLMNIVWMISDFIPLWINTFYVIKIIFASIGGLSIFILSITDFKQLSNFRRFKN